MLTRIDTLKFQVKIPLPIKSQTTIRNEISRQESIMHDSFKITNFYFLFFNLFCDT
jgi:hypothetical protein